MDNLMRDSLDILKKEIVAVDEDGLVAILYEVYRDDTFPAFQKYSLEIFNPLTGPYYRKLAKLHHPAALHMATNGFPSGKLDGDKIPLFPSLEKNKSLVYKPYGHLC
ncbi:hypothetical protein TSMEX_003280 [Taenia solium]|eukprot:TsM_000639600 transcript=TsM_000639600 gene=TsM_000639600